MEGGWAGSDCGTAGNVECMVVGTITPADMAAASIR